MIDYIEANCKLPPLEEPLYDADSDTWDLWFEEYFPKWYKKDAEEQPELICLSFESREELEETLLKLETIETQRKTEDEATKQNQEPVLS
jgi:hypothetical protein